MAGRFSGGSAAGCADRADCVGGRRFIAQRESADFGDGDWEAEKGKRGTAVGGEGGRPYICERTARAGGVGAAGDEAGSSGWSQRHGAIDSRASLSADSAAAGKLAREESNRKCDDRYFGWVFDGFAQSVQG